MSGVELKPCPFCGGEPSIWKVKRFREVGCVKCKAAGPLRDDEEAAAEAWNNRATPDVNEQLREALKEIAEATDPDDPECYRADDREGCLDTVQDIAIAALKASEASHG